MQSQEKRALQTEGVSAAHEPNEAKNGIVGTCLPEGEVNEAKVQRGKSYVREENSQCNYQAVDAQRFHDSKTQTIKRAIRAFIT